MTQPAQEIHPFVNHLYSLGEKQNRGALAALRRGLGQPPGTVADMYRYIVSWLPNNVSRREESAYYLVAALYALHPKSTSTGNLGEHLVRTRKKDGDDALERRFTALLSAHVEDLPDYLRQAVSFLKSKDEPINWDQLFRDLRSWDAPDRRVQKEWARSFWKTAQPSTDEETTSSQKDTE